MRTKAASHSPRQPEQRSVVLQLVRAPPCSCLSLPSNCRHAGTALRRMYPVWTDQLVRVVLYFSEREATSAFVQAPNYYYPHTTDWSQPLLLVPGKANDHISFSPRVPGNSEYERHPRLWNHPNRQVEECEWKCFENLCIPTHSRRVIHCQIATHVEAHPFWWNGSIEVY